MNISQPLEIERKYLISYPDIERLKEMTDYNYTQIFQTYIKGRKNGLSGRVRKRGLDGNFQYTKTYKKDVTDVTRVEIENEITVDEYNELLQHRRKGYNTIEKVRHCFNYQGYTFEIDVYPFWNDRAIMECEVASESILIPIPPCVHVIKEVTSDKRYRNSSLARTIFTDNLSD